MWDLETGRELARFIGEPGIEALALSPDGHGVFAGDVVGHVYWLSYVDPDAPPEASFWEKAGFMRALLSSIKRWWRDSGARDT